MLSMRALLSDDPLLAPELRKLVATNVERAHTELVLLGANACEAAELLDLFDAGSPKPCRCD